MSRTTMPLPSPRTVSRGPDGTPQDARKNFSTGGSSPPAPAASQSDYVGVGVVFDAQMRVINLVKGGAAERSGGILRYDLLVAVDGRSMAAASTEQLKAAVRGPAGTTVVLTFSRKDLPAHFDVSLVRSGLGPPPPAAPLPSAAATASAAPETASNAAINNSDVMLALYAAIDSARADLAQKEDQVSSVSRQLQTAAFHLERERAAAAAAEARRADLVEVMQQLDEETQVLRQQAEGVRGLLPSKQQQAQQSRIKVETMRDSLWEAEEAAIQAKAKLDEIEAAVIEQQDLLQISSVHRLDAEAREEHLKGELARRDQLSAQAQQIDEADHKSLKERVAFLQQQLQKEEEMAAAAKTRLELAQASRISAEEELAKQEAVFAEKQIRIQEADLMLTRGRSVQESVKGALSELESVVRKLQDTKRAKDAAVSELESQLSDLLARSDEAQASAASRLDEERARHAIACASLEQAAAELESKRAQIEGEIVQQHSAHGQRMAVVSAPFDSLAASKAEIEQEQQQLLHALQDTESRARAAFDSVTLLRLKVEETVHHKVHLANQAAALVDSRAHMIQSLEDLFVRERALDADVAQAKIDSANRPLRLKVMQLKEDVVQAQSRLQEKMREVAAARERVNKFWQEETLSGPRDDSHRQRHAALLRQLQGVSERCSLLHDNLHMLAVENQTFELRSEEAIPNQVPFSHSDEVVIGSDGFYGAVL